VAAAKQTSVRVPREAVAALEAYAAKHGKSRDAALRAALQNYVTTQSALEPEQRLTHVTTVLRYPPQPPGRGRPDPRAHLRFRIDTGLKTEATDLGYRLPGQSRRHGHHDYAARPLTDAVMTAIHEAEPFTVTGTEDLPQTLTQRIALALWRLAAAATITEAETQALWTSGDPDLACLRLSGLRTL
jgi:plasmid stability protein